MIFKVNYWNKKSKNYPDTGHRISLCQNKLTSKQYMWDALVERQLINFPYYNFVYSDHSLSYKKAFLIYYNAKGASFRYLKLVQLKDDILKKNINFNDPFLQQISVVDVPLSYSFRHQVIDY